MQTLGSPSGSRRALCAAGDVAAAVAAFALAFLIRIHLPLPLTQFLLPADRISHFYSEWWVVVAAQLAVLYFFGFYDLPRARAAVRDLVTPISLQGLGLAGYYFLTDREFPRSVLLLFVLVNFLLLLAWRRLVLRQARLAPRRVAIVGRGSQARELARKIRGSELLGLAVAGHVPAPDEGEADPASPGEAEPGDDPESAGAPGDLGPCLGSVDDLPALLAGGRVDDIILASSSYPWQTRLLDDLSALAGNRGNVLLLPGPLESLIGRMRYRWVDDVPLVDVVRQTEWRINQPLKRLVDLVGASVLLVVTAPVLGAAAVAVAVTSPGPVLYRQERVGKARRPFTVTKLRTMRVDAEETSGEMLARPEDPRLTPVGGLLRRYRLDELPQLVNVLTGTMSLVGPRPERPGFVARYLAEVPGYAERFSVPPGLTGLAQINGDYHSTAANKLRYDLAYIANWSPWLDLGILLRTVKIVLTSRGV